MRRKLSDPEDTTSNGARDDRQQAFEGVAISRRETTLTAGKIGAERAQLVADVAQQLDGVGGHRGINLGTQG